MSSYILHILYFQHHVLCSLYARKNDIEMVIEPLHWIHLKSHRMLSDAIYFLVFREQDFDSMTTSTPVPT